MAKLRGVVLTETPIARPWRRPCTEVAVPLAGDDRPRPRQEPASSQVSGLRYVTGTRSPCRAGGPGPAVARGTAILQL